MNHTLALAGRVVVARTRLARAAVSINVAAIPGSSVEVARALAVGVGTTSCGVVALIIRSNGGGFVEKIVEIGRSESNESGPDKSNDGERARSNHFEMQ